MKSIKISFLFFFVLFFIRRSAGQSGADAINLKIKELKEQYTVPVLGKIQMYADFDTLVSILERCNPQYLVRKKVTGYDLISEIKNQRVQIENCDNTMDFIKLLKNVFTLTLDEHCDIGNSIWYYSYTFYKKDVKMNKITDRDFGINFHYIYDVFYIYPPTIGFVYSQGKYYLKCKTTFFNDMDSIVLLAGTEILIFNNQPILSYQDSIKAVASRWDFNKKNHYNPLLFVSNFQNNVCFQIDNKTKEYSFTKFRQEEKKWNPFKENEFHIHWFAKDSVLYLKIPSMSYSPKRMQQFKEKILSYHSKSIKSIIIDIRGNTGGNDKAWTELLSVIIKTPIKYPYCFLTNTDNDVIKRIQPRQKNKKRIFECVDTNYPFQVSEEGTGIIKNHKQNLGYEGNIYLLVDEDIYSSAGAFASLCTKTDRIKTIGMPTGKMLGMGATPSVFVLPNSRLIFTMELMLDAAGVSKAEDFYHDHINYPVTPSINYYKYWYDPARPYTIGEKTMYEHDEVFLKALEIIKEKK
jgi:hypothetical protein